MEESVYFDSSETVDILDDWVYLYNIAVKKSNANSLERSIQDILAFNEKCRKYCQMIKELIPRRVMDASASGSYHTYIYPSDIGIVNMSRLEWGELLLKREEITGFKKNVSYLSFE